MTMARRGGANCSTCLPLPQQRAEASLDEVLVGGQRLNDATVPHHDEGDAIGETSFLV